MEGHSDRNPRPTLGDNHFDSVGTFHTEPDGTIVMDDPETSKEEGRVITVITSNSP